MTLPEFDFRGNLDSGRLDQLREAAHQVGAFRVRHPLFCGSRCTEALALARDFFDLPPVEKQRLAIERSPHFRGYSVMHNNRDWREQLHLGREEAAGQSVAPYAPLRGPNLWPDDPEWKRRMLALIDDLERAARDVLAALAVSVGLPLSQFIGENELPYLVVKLIHYQELPNGALRSGVAPHVDFSWITVLLQDDTGGLQIRRRDGVWQEAAAAPGALVIHIGEILEYASRGYYSATPHRVLSGIRSRISVPFFLNPALDTRVEPVDIPLSVAHTPRIAEGEPGTPAHVHRVFSELRSRPFIYGDEEWRRKGLGIYCESCFQGTPARAV